MGKSLWICALALTGLLAPSVLKADDITYNIDLTVGSGSIIGTITTNGDTGVLTAADLVGWSLAVNDGTPLLTLQGPTTGNNSDAVIVGSDLSATSTQLLFDFSGSEGSFLIGANSGSSYFCATSYESCSGGDVPPDITLNDLLTGTYTYESESGDVALGTAVPTVAAAEPPSWSLLLAGLGLLGMIEVMRRRKALGLAQAA
jgi:MYXO-CTERM domain-containing protein